MRGAGAQFAPNILPTVPGNGIKVHECSLWWTSMTNSDHERRLQPDTSLQLMPEANGSLTVFLLSQPLRPLRAKNFP